MLFSCTNTGNQHKVFGESAKRYSKNRGIQHNNFAALSPETVLLLWVYGQGKADASGYIHDLRAGDHPDCIKVGNEGGVPPPAG